MIKKHVAILVYLFFILISNLNYVKAQEETQLRAVFNPESASLRNVFVSPEATTTVIVPDVIISDGQSTFKVSSDETPTKTVKVNIEASPVIVKTETSKSTGITCTKTLNGQCTLFSCSDGTKTNTCDLVCKNTPPPTDPALVGAVSTDEPEITSFFPESGNAGTIVTVYLTKGQKNFSGPDSIEIGGVKAAMNSFSNIPGSKVDFRAEIVVPEGAKTGKITITKSQTFAKPGESNKDFMVVPTQDAPYITSIKPIAGYPGQEVVIEYYMGTKTFSGLDSIEIGGVPVISKLHSDIWSKKPHGYMEKIIIPENAKTGKITLNKKNFGTVTSDVDFIVVPATDAPTILSFSPESGSPGEEVTIKAVAGKKNFSGLDSIYIGETKAEIVSSLTDTSGIRKFTIKVPKEAKTGKIILRKSGTFVDVSSVKDFKVYGAVKSFFHWIGFF